MFESGEHFYYYCRKVLAERIESDKENVNLNKEVFIKLYEAEKLFPEKIREVKAHMPTYIIAMLVRNFRVDINGDPAQKLNSMARYIFSLYLSIIDPESKKRDISIIVNENYDEQQRARRTEFYSQKIEKEFISKKAAEILFNLDRVPGIYLLYDDEGQLLYIGKSITLGERILTSKHERGATRFSYAITKTKADASIYEPYYIAKLKPLLNVEHVTNDETTLTLPELEIAEIRSFSGKEKEEEYVKAGVG